MESKDDDINDLSTLIDNLDEGEIKKFSKALQTLDEFGKFGAAQMTDMYNKVKASEGFALPFQVFVARLNQSEFSHKAFETLLGILKDPDFKIALEGAGKTFKVIADILIFLLQGLVGIAKDFNNVLRMFRDAMYAENVYEEYAKERGAEWMPPWLRNLMYWWEQIFGQGNRGG